MSQGFYIDNEYGITVLYIRGDTNMKTVDKQKKANISMNIKYLLEVEDKPRKKVCSDLGFKYTTFCDWVKGNTAPGYHILEKLGEYFNVEPWVFYEDVEVMKKERAKRLGKYAFGLSEGKLLDMEVIEKLNDEQIKELIATGFRFRHKSLEEYVELSGKPLQASTEIEWGKHVGREVW